MAISMSSTLLFLWPILIMAASCFAGCYRSERDSLLEFKLHLTDPSNRLADWVAHGDCCNWTGVVCHNLTGHVLQLHLRTLSFQEYFGPDHYVDYDEYYDYFKKCALGGKVSSSLLQLKHLRYLDLSNNDFGGVSIPSIFGSMGSLRSLNLSRAGFGGLIPPQLGNLSNLHYLNLRGVHNYNLWGKNLDWVSSLSSLEFLDLSNVDLSKSFDWLKVMSLLPSMVELHFSHCQLLDFSPLLHFNLSSLAILDLSDNFFEGPIPNVLQNMTSFVRELDLSINSFDSSIPNWLWGLSHLQFLNLNHNNLQGQISSDIGNLTSLISLDLSFNFGLIFAQGIPKSFKNFCNLRSLDLSDIKLNQEINNILEILSSGCVLDGLESLKLSHYNLSGNLTDQLGHFKNLKFFSLYGDSINGPIPRSVRHLCNLEFLHLGGVRLRQEINGVLEILSGCISYGLRILSLPNCQLSGQLTDNLSHLKNVISLDLSDNLISGPIPLSLGEMTSLITLFLQNNSISGPIPMSLGELTSLRTLSLFNNKLNETLPVSLGRLSKLEDVDISDNLFEGEVSEIHFANLIKLRSFHASGISTNIALRVSPIWIPPLQLQVLELRSWHIGPQFPIWLRSLKYLDYLDVSNSGILSPIPNWFWYLNSEYSYVNFSHNQMHGLIPNIPSFGVLGSVIDLNSNNFSGVIPYFPSTLSVLDLSYNSFSGSISNFLCHNMHEVKYMAVLNLGGNNLSGEIPDCWMSWKYLTVIKLGNNTFIGNIPNSIGASFLESLHLHDNNLSGVIPSSLANCTSLITLDLSKNKLVGNIPTWVGERLSRLIILNFHANKFDGGIPKELCRISSLHILDLADNSLSGTIPSCFNNFTAMTTRNDSMGMISFDYNASVSFNLVLESILLVMKGNILEYSTNLRFVRSIDLSHNNLSGQIPKDITSLGGLQSLNLSQNTLVGRIPEDIGAMRSLESVDFSKNQLSGEIPESISSLTFLSQLNLSYNKLSGRIPSGTQIQGFDQSSFTGNQLCGLPVTRNCSEEGSDDLPSIGSGRRDDKNGVEVDWFYVSMALGFMVGFWSVVGSLIFIRRWRYFYFHFLHNLGQKICWSFLYKFY